MATGLLFLATVVVAVGGCVWFQHRREVNRRFQIAFFQGHPGEMTRAVEAGADAFRKPGGAFNIPALVFAVENDQRELVQALLAHGAKIDEPKDSSGETPLMIAASINPDLVPVLLDRGADAECADQRGRTALIYAVAYGHEGAVRSLLGHSANPNLPDRAGRTALAYAAALNRVSCIKLLLAHGADPDRAGATGYRALEWLLADGRWSTAALLRNRCRDTPLTEAAILIGACKVGDWKRAHDALERGASANSVSASGATTILIAIQRKDAAMVRLLLEHGADPLAAGRRSQLDWPFDDPRYVAAELGDALGAAGQSGRPELLRMLRSARRTLSAAATQR